MNKIKIEGSCDKRFERVQEEFEKRLNNGADFGGSIAVVEHGELVVDLWGGPANQAQTASWKQDTIVNTWSITKTMVSLAALVLIDRGQLDPNAAVAEYWPEFSQAGKESILVRHLLTHSSGLAGWEENVDIIDICNVPKSTQLLAEQAPWWEPGTASGYHVLTYGHLIGEVIRRVTGQSFSAFFRDEIASPLKADFHISVPLNEQHRIADIIPGPPPPLPKPGSIGFKAFTSPVPLGDFINTITWRSSENGAAGGHGNARSVAEIQSVISHGGKRKGHSLLSNKTIEQALTSQMKGNDLVIGSEIDFGLGYGLAESGCIPFLPKRRIAMWGGAGGSLVINDLERETTFAYIMNRMEPSMLGNDNSLSYYKIFDQSQTNTL